MQRTARCASIALVGLLAGCGDTTSSTPPRRALPAVSVGDLRLEAFSDGAFTLRAGDRTLVAAQRAPVIARRYAEQPRMAFGIYTFGRTDETVLRPGADFTARVDGDALTLRSTGDGATGTLRIRRVSPGEVELRVSLDAASPVRSLGLRLACAPDAAFLGFGEQYNAVDHRGRQFPLWVSEQGIGRPERRRNAFSGDHTTTYFPVPFFLDPGQGIGLAVDTDSRVDADLCATDATEYALEAAAPEPVVFHLYTGPTPADVMREWTRLQGRTAGVPTWAVDGVWLAVQGGPEPVREAVRRARDAGLPLAAIWSQDWVGRREFGLGNVGVRYRWSVDETLYPELPALIAELRTQGVRFLGYMNPFIVPEQDLWEPAVREGYIVRNARGEPITFPISVLTGGVWDVTNPRAVAWYQGFARAALAMGQAGWMHDFGEWLPLDAALHDGSDPARAHNRYPTLWQRAAREVMEAARPDGDWILLSRSGWLRTSQVSQVVWAGDQEATWDSDDGLQTVIPAMVSLGLAGVGYVTHDVAGFSGGPSTKELFQRWVELAAFTPIFRTHEGLRRAENWRWDRDAETRDHFVRFARVHRALAAEWMRLGAEHRATGMPIVRALGLAFPGDRAGYGVRDQYMLGDALLVAPVVTEGATSRGVHLPPGEWVDVWDATRRWTGPRDITVEAPIGRPPVFARTPRPELAALRPGA
jgi:alpha-glucosidase